MKLPALLIDANVRAALQVPFYVQEARTNVVELDGSELLAIEPVGACLLANAARIAKRSGKTLAIQQWSPRLRALLQELGVNPTWLARQSYARTIPDTPVTPTLAMTVSSQPEANKVANELSDRIAAFIPEEDREQMLRDSYGLRIYHSVQPALAYVLSELIDNVFWHARAASHPAPVAWVAAQWYSAGDIVRVAVVDDGCGLLASLQAHDQPPKTHFDAATLAVQPFSTSKGRTQPYAQHTHMGLGLTVCRDLCEKLEGRMYAASGDALVLNPGLSKQEQHRLDTPYLGTIVSLEFHRRIATTGLIHEILSRYTQKTGLRARFD